MASKKKSTPSKDRSGSNSTQLMANNSLSTAEIDGT